ncbi:MAG TPA: hypothetical protein VFV57_09420, partial [Limnobacter sp.]|nr:hypothetical protein [Limnobacter sp.]
AHQAGVSAGDVLVAIGTKRLNEANYKRYLGNAKPGQAVRLIGFRAERLKEFDVLPVAGRSNEWTIEPALEPAAPVHNPPWR